MARNAPGVVKVQRNPATQTMHVVLPKVMLEDVELEPQDLVLFYKKPGSRHWRFRKISEQDKQRVTQAYREGTVISDALNL